MNVKIGNFEFFGEEGDEYLSFISLFLLPKNCSAISLYVDRFKKLKFHVRTRKKWVGKFKHFIYILTLLLAERDVNLLKNEKSVEHNYSESILY
jgi:hypothetical protein